VRLVVAARAPQSDRSVALRDPALEVARHSIPIAERSGRGSNRPPIPRTTKRYRLEENLGAAAMQFTADDLWEIDRAASAIEVHGARYSEHLQKLVGR
jgi:hypothetical protein